MRALSLPHIPLQMRSDYKSGKLSNLFGATTMIAAGIGGAANLVKDGVGLGVGLGVGVYEKVSSVGVAMSH